MHTPRSHLTVSVAATISPVVTDATCPLPGKGYSVETADREVEVEDLKLGDCWILVQNSESRNKMSFIQSEKPPNDRLCRKQTAALPKYVFLTVFVLNGVLLPNLLQADHMSEAGHMHTAGHCPSGSSFYAWGGIKDTWTGTFPGVIVVFV